MKADEDYLRRSIKDPKADVVKGYPDIMPAIPRNTRRTGCDHRIYGDPEMKTSLSSYGELCKIRIALLSSFSAATGFLLAAAELRSEIIILILGVFLLACGSSALNQYQERETDAAMPRTGSRPLPSGRIKPVNALYFSLWLLFSGASTLLLTGALSAPLLGLFAVGLV